MERKLTQILKRRAPQDKKGQIKHCNLLLYLEKTLPSSSSVIAMLRATGKHLTPSACIVCVGVIGLSTVALCHTTFLLSLQFCFQQSVQVSFLCCHSSSQIMFIWFLGFYPASTFGSLVVVGT